MARKEATACLKGMNRDWAETGEGVTATNVPAHWVASVFVWSLTSSGTGGGAEDARGRALAARSLQVRVVGKKVSVSLCTDCPCSVYLQQDCFTWAVWRKTCHRAALAPACAFTVSCSRLPLSVYVFFHLWTWMGINVFWHR